MHARGRPRQFASGVCLAMLRELRGPMSTLNKRTHRYERLARIYDREILPIWSERFGRMLLRRVELPDKGQVLDVACGTGYPAIELLRRMGDRCRLIAIDSSSAMLDVARNKIMALGKRGVFFRTESAYPRLSFADDVYDVVVSNLGLEDTSSPAAALADLTRVTQPGGQVVCTLPLAGTFQEFYDIYFEVLIKHDKHATLARLHDHVQSHPTAETCECWLRAAGLERVGVDVEEFTLLFRSSREFFFAPVIEFGPLQAWKRVAGRGQELQDVFWYIKEAIDAYFGDRAFEVTVRAGCLSGHKPPDGPHEIDKSDGSDEIDGIDPADPPTEPIDPETIELITSELDSIDEAAGLTADELAEVALDAFAEGVSRPDHLDRN
jgi:ubiquinone/menaquinone biosynthesis C-methylase UbiE